MLTIEMPSDRKDLILQLLDSVLTRFDDELPTYEELEEFVSTELARMSEDDDSFDIHTTQSQQYTGSPLRSFVDPVSGGLLVGGLIGLLRYKQAERHHRQNREDAAGVGGHNPDAKLQFCRYRLANGGLCGNKLESIECTPAAGGRLQYTEVCSCDHKIQAFQPNVRDSG
ncbi:hypothetical protein [Marinobacter nauticus]|uniref:hypothetical protein n=1 Tax=Marinobacter nauticus TaxID=2743 RepID=UPI00404513FC